MHHECDGVAVVFRIDLGDQAVELAFVGTHVEVQGNLRIDLDFGHMRLGVCFLVQSFVVVVPGVEAVVADKLDHDVVDIHGELSQGLEVV